MREEWAKLMYERVYKSDATKPTETQSQTSTGDMPKVHYGDANCDGEVTIADSTAILQALGNPNKYGLSKQGAFNWHF